jgi:hypothetical protein
MVRSLQSLVSRYYCHPVFYPYVIAYNSARFFSHAGFRASLVTLISSRMLRSAASQFQSSERVSVRLAAREGSGASSPQSTSASPDLSHAQPGPQGQPFEQHQNVNGKRALHDDGGGEKGTGKRKKKNGMVPVNAPPQTLNSFGMPLPLPTHMSMNGEGTNDIPLDPSLFVGAEPLHNGGSYPNYPPPGQDPSFPSQPHLPQQFDPSQQGGPSQPQHYALGNATPPEKLVPELQFARCMSTRYKPDPFPRCVSCTRRWAGDTCRFQGIR